MHEERNPALRTTRCNRHLFTALALLLVATTACASNPASRRARAISDADKSAKSALARENELDAGKIPARTLAVLPFSVADRDTLLRPLGFGLADLLMGDLSRSPEVRLVERIQTNAMLKELNMVDEGVTDPRTAPRVGKLIGARRLLFGSASLVGGNTVRLDARLVDVIAGTVADVVSATAPLDRVIEAEKALALLLFERLGITLTPAQRAAVEQRQTTQLGALVAYGRGVEAEARGDAAGATAAFEEASRLDAAFSMARTQASGTTATTQRASSVARVTELATQAVNATAPVRVAEAADAPLASGSTIGIIFTIRVTP